MSDNSKTVGSGWVRTAGVALTLALTAAAGAQAAPATPNFSGAWVLDADSFNPPSASLTPAGARKREEMQAPDAAGSINYSRKWCTYVGVPQLMQTTIPIDIRQNWREVAIISPLRAESRHIYLDPRIDPDPDVYDNTTNGFSTARWQGASLVVDTEGFNDGGVLELPGGGVKSSNSRLREVFRMIDQDTLQVTATWTDRTTMRRPHTYTQRFRRVQGEVWFTSAYCTPVKAMRAAGLTLPPGEGGE